MKFGFYTDLHLAGKNPRHRTDNFPQAMLDKLREVYEVAEAEGCQFMAFGGDFFNNHRIFSFNVIGDAQDIVCDTDVRTYSCIGEHDLYGHSLNTYSTSTLAFFLRRCAQMEVLHEPLEVVPGFVLHAKHEPEDMFEAMKRPVDPSKCNILICHELITCNRAPYEVIHTSTLTPCPFDLVVSGDLHDGYEPHEVDGTWFCNPGSLARRNINEGQRVPKIAIIEIEKGQIPIIEYRMLRCAKPGDDVFGESVVEVASSADAVNSKFAEQLMSFEAEAVDVHDLIQKVARAVGLRRPVADYLATKKEKTA